MLGPSPDWTVGLSAEDLCTKECGWVQKVVQDLIPWDAGTDSGVTYEVSTTPYPSPPFTRPKADPSLPPQVSPCLPCQRSQTQAQIHRLADLGFLREALA